jgi:hypothetical protein
MIQVITAADLRAPSSDEAAQVGREVRPRKYPPGVLCGVFRDDQGRGFGSVRDRTDRPAGSPCVMVEGTDVAYQRNQCLRVARETIPGCAWVLMMDQDQRVHEADLSSLILRLLDWNVPVVSGVVCQRAHPFPLNAYVDMRSRPPRRLEMAALPEEGLVKVDAVGAGLILIRREAWEAVGDPWFRVGSFSPETQGEDLDFTWRVTRTGLGVYVDAGLAVGHEIRAAVWPGRRDRRPWAEFPGVPSPFWAPLGASPTRNGGPGA